MVYSEITCYVNMTVPDPSQTALDDGLLMTWGLLNVFGVILHVSLMVVAMLLYIAILQVSAHEGPEDELRPEECYSRDSNPNGIVMSEGQFLGIWNDRYEVYFQYLISFFSWGAGIFFATLIPTAHVRYFMNSAAAWIQCGALFVALILWGRIHSSIVPSLMRLRGIAAGGSQIQP